MDALLKTDGVRTHRGEFFLEPVTLEVPKGSIVGLIGENGSGKTTLLKCILGLCWHRGEVTLLPDTPAGRDWRQDIGILLGEPGFPDYVYPYQI